MERIKQIRECLKGALENLSYQEHPTQEEASIAWACCDHADALLDDWERDLL